MARIGVDSKHDEVHPFAMAAAHRHRFLRMCHWPFIARLASPALVAMALWPTGLGHGDFTAAVRLLPFGVLAMTASSSGFVTLAVVGCGQWVLYGAILAAGALHLLGVAVA